MKCRYCNSEIADDSVYCEFCGKKLVGKHINFLIVLGVLLGIGIVGGITAFVLYQNNNFVGEAISPMTVEKTLSPEERAELIAQGYVDLGLPSGTLWKDRNECGFYDYDEAIQLFGDTLPTKEQFQELIDYCQWTWGGWGNTPAHYTVTGPNQSSVIFTIEGYQTPDGEIYGQTQCGIYWSSTKNEESENSYCLHAYREYNSDNSQKEKDDIFVTNEVYQTLRKSVHLAK